VVITGIGKFLGGFIVQDIRNLFSNHGKDRIQDKGIWIDYKNTYMLQI